MGFFCVNDLNAIMDQCVTASWIVNTCLTAQTPNLRQSYKTESKKSGTVNEKGQISSNDKILITTLQPSVHSLKMSKKKPKQNKKSKKYLQETQSDLSNYKCFSPVTYSHSLQRCYFAAAEK